MPTATRFPHWLPGLLRGLADPKAVVRETGTRRNWMYSAIVEVPAQGTHYGVFFELRRARKDYRHLQDLEMVVESAYAADPAKPQPNILGPMKFVLLAGLTVLRKPVSTRR